jgi:hypothetical protein
MSLTFLTVTNAFSKQGAFALYSSIGFAFTLYFYYYLPETRGLSLEDITALFGDGFWGNAHLNKESGAILNCGNCGKSGGGLANDDESAYQENNR